MTTEEALEKLLRSYETYYNVVREPEDSRFAARAEFHSHGEKYVLVRRAKIWEEDSHEYVYFASAEHLTEALVAELAEACWRDGLARVAPAPNHRNSDITLQIVARTADPEARRAVRKLRRSKNYQMGLQGWSSLRAVAYELSDGGLSCNRQGRDLKKLFGKIFKSSEMGVVK